jgi:DNA replication protein DnaC
MADPNIAAAFHEVYAKTPKSVVKTGKTGAAKTAMLTAIALSKARAMTKGISKLGDRT